MPAPISARRDDVAEARAPLTFWLLLLAVWGSLNLVFVSGDLFTLYVALELLTFAGVPLVCLDGRAETLRAALRYLVFALLGSVLYLLGAVLLYGAYGTLDIPSLAARVRPDLPTLVAAALMTTGLLAKTALFPLHIWLPPAHAGAPAAASALLSALVIKGSWFLVVRLWFDVFPRLVTPAAAQLLAALGATVIVVGEPRGAAPGAAQAPGRLLDPRADRLPLPHVSARLRGRGAGPRAGAGRRRPAGDRARDGEGVDVHGGGAVLCRARPRPHRRARAAQRAHCR